MQANCPMCGTKINVNGVSADTFADAVIAGAENLDGLQQLAYLLGVGFGHGQQETLSKALEQFAALFFTIEANVLAMPDGQIKDDLLKMSAKYAKRMETLHQLRSTAK